MQTLQLYIEGQIVDLFKDETISVTQTIQNVKDIDKVFTDFSKTFTLPASKANNKIFKHYYNFSINGGFDARNKKSANINLNGNLFTKGKVKLEGVGLKNNKSNTYRITFFGNTVDIKDLLGEDKLDSLLTLNTLNEPYTPAGIEAGLKRNALTEDVVVPLMTHTQRLYYDSTNGQSYNELNRGNLYYETGAPEHGVAWNELKYALRIDKIIKAIESVYGIEFSTDFFNSTNERYYKLFMWLHRKKGNVIPAGSVLEYPKLVDGWSTASGNILSMLNSTTARIVNSLPLQFIDNFELTLDRATAEPYNISILRDGEQVFSESNITSLNRAIGLEDVAQSGAEYTVVLTYAAGFTFTKIEWLLRYSFPDEATTVDTFSTGSFSVTAQFEFIITQQIPDIKVIDFLTGLFKMFNLTAFVQNDTGIIKVLPLDEFYASFNSYDITKRILVSESDVDVALPYKEVSFYYEDTDTFLAKTHNQLFNIEYSRLDFTQVTESGENLDGELYNVIAPFAHLKFERLLNIQDLKQTTIQCGFCVDDNQEPYIGKPILFYPITTPIQDDGVAASISFVTSDGAYSSHTEITANIVMPANTVTFVDSVTVANIHFSQEKNEYHNTELKNSLFDFYYKNYIVSVFNSKNRLTKVTAYLPLRILLNYTLADRFIISNNSYKINSITTDLQSGKSEIELLNDL
jgi:hypothetical protein